VVSIDSGSVDSSFPLMLLLSSIVAFLSWLQERDVVRRGKSNNRAGPVLNPYANGNESRVDRTDLQYFDVNSYWRHTNREMSSVQKSGVGLRRTFSSVGCPCSPDPGPLARSVVWLRLRFRPPKSGVLFFYDCVMRDVKGQRGTRGRKN